MCKLNDILESYSGFRLKSLDFLSEKSVFLKPKLFIDFSNGIVVSDVHFICVVKIPVMYSTRIDLFSGDVIDDDVPVLPPEDFVDKLSFGNEDLFLLTSLNKIGGAL